jgi:hypothetical protein
MVSIAAEAPPVMTTRREARSKDSRPGSFSMATIEAGAVAM